MSVTNRVLSMSAGILLLLSGCSDPLIANMYPGDTREQLPIRVGYCGGDFYDLVITKDGATFYMGRVDSHSSIQSRATMISANGHEVFLRIEPGAYESNREILYGEIVYSVTAGILSAYRIFTVTHTPDGDVTTLLGTAVGGANCFPLE